MLSFLRPDAFEPVSIKMRGGVLPGIFYARRLKGADQRGQRCKAAALGSALAQIKKRGLCFAIEIIGRQDGVAGRFAFQVSSYVSAILTHQSVGLIFKMPLQKNEEAVFLLDKSIEAVAGDPGQNTVTLR